MAERVWFVTGTDTGVGKTLVATAILELAAQAGLRTVGVKPVAAGCEWLAGGLVNPDALMLQAAATIELEYAQVNPVALEPAIAPHIAAALEGRPLSAEDLLRHCAALPPSDLLVAEGAGGWLVPLNETDTLADVATGLQSRIILVVGMRLGCLNHALLTAAAVRARGLELAGWVGNCIEKDMPELERNLATLGQRLDAPCLGSIPWLEHCETSVAARHLDIAALLGTAK